MRGPFLTSLELRAAILNNQEKIVQFNILVDLALREPDIMCYPGGPREVAFLDAFVKLFLSHGYKVVPISKQDETSRNEYLGQSFGPVIDFFSYRALKRNKEGLKKNE